MAPEIFLNEGYEGFGVDVWSVGVVLYIIYYVGGQSSFQRG